MLSVKTICFVCAMVSILPSNSFWCFIQFLVPPWVSCFRFIKTSVSISKHGVLRQNIVISGSVLPFFWTFRYDLRFEVINTDYRLLWYLTPFNVIFVFNFKLSLLNKLKSWLKICLVGFAACRTTKIHKNCHF